MPGLPVADTVKRVDGERGGRDASTATGSCAAQTPQAFVAESLRAALARASSADATDCAALVEARGGRRQGRRGRPAAAQGDDAGGSRAGRVAGCDRRLPHAPARRRTERSTSGSMRSSAFVEVARRAASTRSASRSTSTTSARRGESGRCRTSSSAAATTSTPTATPSSRRSAGGCRSSSGSRSTACRSAPTRLAEILAPYPWDYLLGSVHLLDGLALDMEPSLVGELGPEEACDRYFVELGELARSGHVDVLAHPDLAKFFGRPRRP